MKFTEITLVIFCITLSLTAMTMLDLVPSPINNGQAVDQGDLRQGPESYDVEDGKIICSDDAATSDAVCRIRFIEDDQLFSGLQESTDVFGFSDIIRGVKILSDVFYKTVFKVGDLFDHFIPECREPTPDGTGGFYCSEENRNKLHDVKFFFITPIYLIYMIAMLEMLTGRRVGG